MLVRQRIEKVLEICIKDERADKPLNLGMGGE
jgi:hypothetical protein